MFIFDSRYHPYIPFIFTVIIFVASWFAMKQKFLKKNQFNMFWNSVQILFLVGIMFNAFVMMYQSDLPIVKDATFDFRFWHVQFGIVFSTILFGHLLTRWVFYLQQLKKSFRS